jgi:hypothetical protein
MYCVQGPLIIESQYTFKDSDIRHNIKPEKPLHQHRAYTNMAHTATCVVFLYLLGYAAYVTAQSDGATMVSF